MNTSAAMDLMIRLLQATIFTAGPLLAVALLAGVLVGIIQSATQINEASVSFLVKIIAVVVAGIVVGPALARHVIDYTKATYSQISEVSR